MALKITDECIDCGACEEECPNHAIYEGGAMWTLAEGTEIASPHQLSSGEEIDPFEEQEPVSEDFFYIVPDKCTECQGFHDEPQCDAVCPVECCIPDPEHEESEEALLAKQEVLHG